MKTINDYADLVKEKHALNKILAPVETDLTSASQAYAIGQKFIYDGILYKAKTAIVQGAVLVLNTNYEAADDFSSEIEALTNKLNNEIVTRSALSAKNILPFDLAEIKALNTNGTWAGNVYTYRGVAFTVNSDGTISATGTATGGNASIKLFAASSNYEMLGKEVILTGCPSNGSASTYRIQAYRMASADGSTGTYFDDGAGTDAFTVLNDASGTVGSFAVAVYENATVTNLLFKPMVRLASDPDATYQPYAKTNRELTAENQTLTNEVDTIVNDLTAKNFLNIDLAELKTLNTSGTWADNVYSANGLTFTVNTDKTITVSGTATANTNLSLKNDISISGDYILSGCPVGGTQVDSEGYNIQARVDGSWVSAKDSGDGLPITVSSIIDRTLIHVANGTVMNNHVFKPMIRPASIISDAFVPYAMTNRELTDAIANSYVFMGMETQTVTADGVKTYKQLIEELRNNVNSYVTSLGSDYYIITRAIEIWTIQYNAALPKMTRGLYDCRYRGFYFDGANAAHIRECFPSNTTNTYLKDITFNTTPTILVNDMTDNAPTSGATVIANFEVYKKV